MGRTKLLLSFHYILSILYDMDRLYLLQRKRIY
jgi:hypothetical protein